MSIYDHFSASINITQIRLFTTYLTQQGELPTSSRGLRDNAGALAEFKLSAHILLLLCHNRQMNCGLKSVHLSLFVCYVVSLLLFH